MKTKIKIDHTKCTKPEDCRKCLQACPPAIFVIYAPEKYSNDPKEWKVDVIFTDLCTKCYECINVCPKDAIEIK